MIASALIASPTCPQIRNINFSYFSWNTLRPCSVEIQTIIAIPSRKWLFSSQFRSSWKWILNVRAETMATDWPFMRAIAIPFTKWLHPPPPGQFSADQKLFTFKCKVAAPCASSTKNHNRGEHRFNDGWTPFYQFMKENRYALTQPRMHSTLALAAWSGCSPEMPSTRNTNIISHT